MYKKQSGNPNAKFASYDKKKLHGVFLQDYTVVLAFCVEREIEILLDDFFKLMDVVEHSNTIEDPKHHSYLE